MLLHSFHRTCISIHSPRYPERFGVGFTFNVMAGVCCTALSLGLRAESRHRDQGLRDSRLASPKKSWIIWGTVTLILVYPIENVCSFLYKIDSTGLQRAIKTWQ